ncbi:MAG: MFS transporter [Dehalococcoidales bacterium]|nr:MFS transporter [Dehalococcoidales bacterium]
MSQQHPPSLSKLFYGWIIALCCTLITLTNGGIFFTFGIFFKPVAFDLGWSRSEFAINYGVMLAAYAPGAYFTGKLADRFSPRKVMLVAAILVGLGYFGCSRAQDLPGMVLSYTVMGLGLGSTLGLPTATIQRWFLKLRGTMLGIVNAGMGVGGFIFAPLSNSLIDRYGWREAYLTIGLVFAAVLALSACFLIAEPRTKHLSPYGYEPGLSHDSHSLGSVDTPTSLSQVFRHPVLWVITGLYIVSFMPSFFISTHLVPYITDRSVSAASAAQGVGLMAATSAAGRLIMNWVAGKIGWIRSLVLCYIVAALSVVSLLIINTEVSFYLFAVAYGISWGSTISLLGGTVAYFFGLAALSEIMGFVLGVATLVGCAIPWVAGVVFDRTNTYIPALVLAAAFYLGAGVLSWSLKSRAK